MCVVVVPFAVLTFDIGFVVYFNHTHPDLPWFTNRDRWSHLSGQLDATIDLEFPRSWRISSATSCTTARITFIPACRWPILEPRNVTSTTVRIAHGGRTVEPSPARRDPAHVSAVRLDAMRWLSFDGVPTTERSSHCEEALLKTHEAERRSSAQRAGSEIVGTGRTGGARWSWTASERTSTR